MTKIANLTNVLTAADIANDANIRFGLDNTGDSLSYQLSLAELKKTGVQSLNVYQKGVTGDGVANDATPFQSAVTAAVHVYIPYGTILLVNTPITKTGNLHLFGGGTIRSGVTGALLTVTGDLTLENIHFDGNANDTTTTLVNHSGLDQHDLVISDCTFDNLHSVTTAIAITLNNTRVARITNTRVADVTALANTTIGDTNGACRGIYVSGDAHYVVIDRCEFDNINSVDGADDPVHEDADAIHVFSPASEVQHVLVSRSTFNDVGGRVLKCQGTSTSSYAMDNCRVVSSWVGTPDGSGDDDNGMRCVMEILNGHGRIRNTSLSGGSCLFFAVFGASAIGGSVESCSHEPEYHEYVHGTNTAFVFCQETSLRTRVTVSDCQSKNTFYGVNVPSGAAEICAHDNRLETSNSGIVLVSARGYFSITSNILSGRQQTFTAATDDTITCADHGLANDDRVYVYSTGTLPAGLSEGTAYYVIDSSTTFKLSETSGGAAVDITSTGTGTHTFVRASGYGVYVGNNLIHADVSGNTISGKQDATYLLTQTGSGYFFNGHSNRCFDNYRNILSNFGSHTYPNVNFRNNYPDTTRITA